VLRHVQTAGFRVRAMTRDPEKPSARALAERGVEVVRGDLDDRASLDRAAKGTYGVFSVQDPWLHGVPKEIAQGIALADAAKAAGVRHFVYGSVGTAERKTGVPHFESKGTIERHVEKIGLSWTFIRPAFFMDSLVPSLESRARLIWGALFTGLGGKGRLQLTAVDDIGRLAAEAFARPEELAGKAIELAGDELTMDEIAALYAREKGKAPRPIRVPFPILRIANHEAEINFRWVGKHGWHFDLPSLRRTYPWVQTFASWLRSKNSGS
jgi:uncharacterized protein YbjT (DUF2867 family)